MSLCVRFFFSYTLFFFQLLSESSGSLGDLKLIHACLLKKKKKIHTFINLSMIQGILKCAIHLA